MIPALLRVQRVRGHGRAVEDEGAPPVPGAEITGALFQLRNVVANPDDGAARSKDVVEECRRQSLAESGTDVEESGVLLDLTTLVGSGGLRRPTAEVPSEVGRHRRVQLAQPSPPAGSVVENQRAYAGRRLHRGSGGGRDPRRRLDLIREVDHGNVRRTVAGELAHGEQHQRDDAQDDDKRNPPARPEKAALCVVGR
jgi:hypothetical protein